MRRPPNRKLVLSLAAALLVAALGLAHARRIEASAPDGLVALSLGRS